MGRGDNLIGAGFARGAAARGKRIAFGRQHRQRILWDKYSAEIFRDNPNVAAPGSEHDDDLEWIPFYSGHRKYNRLSPDKKRWIWNLDFRSSPGEFFFSEDELAWAESLGSGFVVAEPNVEYFKRWAANKDWPADRYREVARGLAAQGHEVVQFLHGGPRVLDGVRLVAAPSFRHAAAALNRSALYVGPEGGMHHAAAAVGTKAVVIFGGFIPPQVTGYEGHVNLTGGAKACGSMFDCAHCRAALDAISADEVLNAAGRLLCRETVAA